MADRTRSGEQPGVPAARNTDCNVQVEGLLSAALRGVNALGNQPFLNPGKLFGNVLTELGQLVDAVPYELDGGTRIIRFLDPGGERTNLFASLVWSYNLPPTQYRRAFLTRAAITFPPI